MTHLEIYVPGHGPRALCGAATTDCATSPSSVTCGDCLVASDHLVELGLAELVAAGPGKLSKYHLLMVDADAWPHVDRTGLEAWLPREGTYFGEPNVYEHHNAVRYRDP